MTSGTANLNPDDVFDLNTSERNDFMATIGLSHPFYAKYANNGSTVTYSGGGSMGKFTELQVNLNDADDNVLRGDNAPAETDNQFAGGTLDASTTELLAAVAKDVLGVKQEAVGATPAISTKDATWNIYDDDQVAPNLGFGGVIKKQVDNQIKWVAFVFKKIQFRNSIQSAVTQGETIEWQTPTLTATIMRSDEPKHEWYRDSSLLDSEEDAIILVKSMLNITDPVTPANSPAKAAAKAA